MSREGSQLADYYPILARAVSQLATDNSQARQEMYEHVRTILITQLRKDQRISGLGIIDERIALESAILKLEAELPSLDDRRPETFDTNIPLHDAHDEIENSFRAAKNSSDIAFDFASLLREPASPAPPSNNSCIGVFPPPSRLFPKKLSK